MSYKPDRIERKNRKKAIVLTALIYGGIFAFFLLKDDIPWTDMLPETVAEWIGDQEQAPAVAGTTEEVRP
jgi:hypothetical protein